METYEQYDRVLNALIKSMDAEGISPESMSRILTPMFGLGATVAQIRCRKAAMYVQATPNKED